MSLRTKLIIALALSIIFTATAPRAQELDGENITAKQASILLANYYQVDAALAKHGKEIISASIDNGLSIVQHVETICKDKEGTAKFECLGAAYYGVTKVLKNK